MDNQPTLSQIVGGLVNRIEALEKLQKGGTRIYQQDIVPGAVKQRHISEGVIFIRSGLAANRPSTLTVEASQNGSAMYWATDTFALSIWTGSAWKSVTLS